ncbi:hypothetical protein Taro_048402 [Colocasia esculenta]|uniref:Uncharacterized protein n=1 Tax=Colocasia esculenta TaxID=4460 RepID=A0A843X575_COLES|nr:hypothetical protein [Colocasia esculenta]
MLTTHTTSAHAHNSHCWQRTANKPPPRTSSNELLKRVGCEPREQGSVGITSPLPARAAGTPTSGNKTTLQSSKARNAYHIVLQSNENRETPQPQPGSGQTRLPQDQWTNPRHTLAETTELTEHRSNHVRPESHDTSTNILDLHKVGKEQPGATPRDTKQPSENDVSPSGTATSDLHKVEGPQAEPPCTSNMPRGHGTT